MVTEGLIIYLTYEQVAELSMDLSAQNHFHRWFFDLTSAALLEMIQKEMQPALKGSGAVFQFAPEEGEAFFEKYGWKPIESRSKLKVAAKLNRLYDEIKPFADMPEPPGTHRPFPWSGDCLLENVYSS